MNIKRRVLPIHYLARLEGDAKSEWERQLQNLRGEAVRTITASAVHNSELVLTQGIQKSLTPTTPEGANLESYARAYSAKDFKALCGGGMTVAEIDAEQDAIRVETRRSLLWREAYNRADGSEEERRMAAESDTEYRAALGVSKKTLSVRQQLKEKNDRLRGEIAELLKSESLIDIDLITFWLQANRSV